jgi:hypothetical protein
LRVADGTEAAEEFARDLAELQPGRIGVDFLHDGSKRAATANGDTQVVDGIGFGSRTESVELGDDATRPVGKPTVFGTRARKRQNCKR